MINRELIRIKVLQLTYAYYQNADDNLNKAEKELLFSLSKSYDLYRYLLILITAITDEESKRIEIISNIAKREGKELPSHKFINNKFAQQISNNKYLKEFNSTFQHRWDDDIELVRKLCDSIEQLEEYYTYVSFGENSYKEDKDLWKKIYKKLIQENSDIDSMLEEKSLYWNDDKEIIDTFVMKSIKRFEETNGENQEILPEYNNIEDKDFAIKLFRSSIEHATTYRQYIAENSRNWDFSRLAYMDVIIMQLAIAEMINFPNISISVSINEYVNLAKLYSTYKSGSYINGMLDNIARRLISEGKLLKTMS